MPAVLVEVGYMSNHEESQRLNTPSYREAAAQAVAAGVLAYVRHLGAEHI
jgi:N-acetylmuramoyl-L-alanine amidase